VNSTITPLFLACSSRRDCCCRRAGWINSRNGGRRGTEGFQLAVTNYRAGRHRAWTVESDGRRVACWTSCYGIAFKSGGGCTSSSLAFRLRMLFTISNRWFLTIEIDVRIGLQIELGLSCCSVVAVRMCLIASNLSNRATAFTETS